MKAESQQKDELSEKNEEVTATVVIYIPTAVSQLTTNGQLDAKIPQTKSEGCLVSKFNFCL